MDLVLKRRSDGYREDGIFSDLCRADTGESIAVSIEHAFPAGIDGSDRPLWGAIIQPGTYTCVRGQHHLASMADGVTFETFEVTGVEGHSGLVFHKGNVDADTKGCVCLGLAFIAAPVSPLHVDMVLNSARAFDKFLSLQIGYNSFTLTVKA